MGLAQTLPGVVLAQKGDAPKATPTPEPKGEPKAQPKPPEEKTEAPKAPESQGAEGSLKDAVSEVVKKYKLTVDGKEEEVDEDTLVKLAQKTRGLDRKLSEARLQQAQAEKLVQLLKTNPRAVLAHPAIGHDIKKLAEEIIMEQIELEKMSPEQRELREIKAKLQAAEDEKKQLAETKQKEDFERLTQHYAGQYEVEVVDALQSSGLPKTPETVRLMAHYMAEGLKRGIVLKASQVTDLVKGHFQTSLTELLGSMPRDKILAILGEDVAKKVREADLERVKNPTGEVAKQPQKGELPEPKQPKRKITDIDDFREKIARIKEE